MFLREQAAVPYLTAKLFTKKKGFGTRSYAASLLTAKQLGRQSVAYLSLTWLNKAGNKTVSILRRSMVRQRMTRRYTNNIPEHVVVLDYLERGTSTLREKRIVITSASI